MAFSRTLSFLIVGEQLEDAENSLKRRAIFKTLRLSIHPFDLPNDYFLQEFRLPKFMVQDIIEELEPFAPPTIRTSAIPFDRKVFATLQFLSSGSYQRLLGSSYNIGLSQPMISRSVALVTDMIVEHIMPRWIKFPQSEAEKNVVKRRFYDKFNYAGVLGALDCTHVEIIAPPTYDETYPALIYLDRKSNFSLNVEAVCDSNCFILALNARFPGSVHDSAIWKLSQVQKYLSDSYTAGDKSTRLIGDSGYPLQPWLFTPFANPETGSVEERFNNMHCSARNVIERAFGILKQRFRALFKHRVLNYHPVRAGKIVYAAATLNNMAIHNGIQFDDYDSDYHESSDDEEEDAIELRSQQQRTLNNLGQQSRAALIRNTFI